MSECTTNHLSIDVDNLSRETLITVLDALPVCTFFIENEEIRCNRASKKTTGYDREEISTLSDFFSKGGTIMKTIRGNKSNSASGGVPEIVVGIAWYYPEQWAALLDVSIDRDSLEKTHGAWLRLAEKAMFDYKRAGGSPRKVYIDVEKLVAWCNERNRPVDGPARAAFVQSQLKRNAEGE